MARTIHGVLIGGLLAKLGEYLAVINTRKFGGRRAEVIGFVAAICF